MKRPVTIVTGFLGSGKTTLLSRVLGAPDTSDVAVLVNEFGEVGLDHHLLRRVNERTTLLGNGCVCCSRREDLVENLLDLLSGNSESPVESTAVRRVVIETTGLADPAPILFTIFEHPVLRHHFEVDGVVATVDAVNGDLHLDKNPESVKQVAAADMVVVTKTDLAPDAGVHGLEARLSGINPSARLSRGSRHDIAAILEGGFGAGTHAGSPTVSHPSGGTSSTESVSVTFDGPVDWAAFGVWLSMLLHARGEGVLRVKGMLDVDDDGPVVLNGVQHIIHPPRHLDEWPDEDSTSRIVFITRGVEAGEILSSLGAFSGMLGASPLPLHARRETNKSV